MKGLEFLYNITEISHVQEHVIYLYDPRVESEEHVRHIFYAK